MKNYEVLKSFFKLSEQKNYEIGDIVQLSDDDAKDLIKYNFVKKTKKND